MGTVCPSRKRKRRPDWTVAYASGSDRPPNRSYGPAFRLHSPISLTARASWGPANVSFEEGTGSASVPSRLRRVQEHPPMRKRILPALLGVFGLGLLLATGQRAPTQDAPAL